MLKRKTLTKIEGRDLFSKLLLGLVRIAFFSMCFLGALNIFFLLWKSQFIGLAVMQYKIIIFFIATLVIYVFYESIIKPNLKPKCQ